MAAGLAQIGSGVAGTGAGLSSVMTPTGVNNLVVVHIGVAAGETCTSVLDDKGNAFVLSSALTIAGGTRLIYQAYGVQVIPGSTAIVALFSAAMVAKVVGSEEYTGCALSNAAVSDTQTTGTGTSTAVAASTLTPAAAGELLVATMGTATAVNFTAGAGYTLASGSNPGASRSQYNLSGGVSETGPATLATLRNWGEILHAYKLAPVGQGPLIQGGAIAGQGVVHGRLVTR